VACNSDAALITTSDLQLYIMLNLNVGGIIVLLFIDINIWKNNDLF